MCNWNEPNLPNVHGVPLCAVDAFTSTNTPSGRSGSSGSPWLPTDSSRGAGAGTGGAGDQPPAEGRPLWDGSLVRVPTCELEYGPLNCDFVFRGTNAPVLDEATLPAVCKGRPWVGFILGRQLYRCMGRGCFGSCAGYGMPDWRMKGAWEQGGGQMGAVVRVYMCKPVWRDWAGFFVRVHVVPVNWGGSPPVPALSLALSHCATFLSSASPSDPHPAHRRCSAPARSDALWQPYDRLFL